MNNFMIGKRLIELRGDRPQREIAAKVGISVSALGMYERGERIPRDEIKVRIARFYNRTVDYIFFNQNDTDSVESVNA